MENSFSYLCGDIDVTISVRFIGACFDICYLHSNLVASPNLSESLKRSCRLVNGDNAEHAIEELHRLKEPFVALMAKLAPTQQPQDYTIFDYYYVPRLVLEATAGRDDGAIQPHFKGALPRQLFRPPGRYVHGEEWLNSIKSFTSRQLGLVTTSSKPEHHPCLRGPSKVLAEDGTLCYFKENAFGREFKVETGEGKPWMYQRIAAAIESKLLRRDIHICRLYGVVTDEDRDVFTNFVYAPNEELATWGDDAESLDLYSNTDPDYSKVRKCWLKRFVGILLTYVENKGTLHGLLPRSSNELRHRWVAEIGDLVEELHAAGLVWGDAKPHNVLVDKENRLWLIDFDGGYTVGWVDHDKKDTQEGDLQGVKRIQEWLVKRSAKPINRFVDMVDDTGLRRS